MPPVIPGMRPDDMSPPAVRAAGRRAEARRGASQARDPRSGQLAGWLCLVPFLVGQQPRHCRAPRSTTVYYSFTDWTGIGGAAFVGLDNYRQLVSDDNFRTGFAARRATGFGILPNRADRDGPPGLLPALAGPADFQLLFRLVYFIPYIIASVVNAAIWKNIYDRATGGCFPCSPMPGVSSLQGVAILGNKSSLPSGRVGQQLGTGGASWWWCFWPRCDRSILELYDAVKIDGGGRWRESRDVTLPGIPGDARSSFFLHHRHRARCWPSTTSTS